MPVELNIIESVTELDTTVVEVVLSSASEPGPAGPGVAAGGTTGQVLVKASDDDYDTEWETGGGGGGAPTDVDYLVGTASGGLSAEIVVGTSPGGELGGTWASPTVDATHSGSSHASVQAAAEATAAGELATHAADTTGIHGISDTSALETTAGAQSKIDTHSSDTTSVHGIADTSALLDTEDIGTTVQAFDADLSIYAGITPSANVQSILGAANYAAIRTLLTLVIGTNVQAWDADLDTYAGITPSANVQSLLGAANYAAMRTLLDLEAGTDFPSLSVFNDHSARHEDGGADEISLAGLDGTPTELTNHLNDTSDAHDASAISVADAGSYTSETTVEGVTQELYASRYALLFESTLGSAAASIDTGANGVPGDYEDLRIVIVARSTQAATVVGLLLRFNNDSGANYDYTYIRNNNATVTGNSAAGDTEVELETVGASAAASVFGTWDVQVPEYAATVAHKTGSYVGGFAEADVTRNRHRSGSFRWRNTAAITRVAISLGSDTLDVGSTLRVYGIR